MLCVPLDWQYAELPSSTSDAGLCTVLVCKISLLNKYFLMKYVNVKTKMTVMFTLYNDGLKKCKCSSHFLENQTNAVFQYRKTKTKCIRIATSPV